VEITIDELGDLVGTVQDVVGKGTRVGFVGMIVRRAPQILSQGTVVADVIQNLGDEVLFPAVRLGRGASVIFLFPFFYDASRARRSSVLGKRTRARHRENSFEQRRRIAGERQGRVCVGQHQQQRKGVAMNTTVTIGKRLVPLDHIALAEPFDPSAYPEMKTQKAFRTRVVFIDRQSVLTEDALDMFASTHGFRVLEEESVATNPLVRFSVESFVPAEGFQPTKPFQTRLLWRDLDGNTQSKLLLSPPNVVLASAVTGAGEAPAAAGEGVAPAKRQTASAGRRRSRRREASAQPA
jgi:hypothetical protein